ncbi:bifunctional pyr operon transcriptional regulator/uracil phosphoribosyltransferase PyrR [Allofranklinella schreckenbergeri]|uniref:Bifunctional pyr operon transcriptional regulator/uracil phosphoribosyltransferase PyrR n=1 Tax=Allofranklinella schreckenbergeri TaxID=1076744 RepID=A0A3M6R932_9BURK|nr:bifunctional pyr operon transcriptional regulator/uracil phosphoribosyltransferase PyrR [Allofranklinella schreckenbergeri]RMX11228.1 bifunctional pyr operon transcriptional regulator/uracil phosphoribosyltransferase PyrR [Allofranklinella schreckenbergeri]
MSDTAPHTAAGFIALNAESLYLDLHDGVQRLMQQGLPDAQGRAGTVHLAGITSGGVWLLERLVADLQLSQGVNTLSSAMHRDDFAQRGLSSGAQTALDFDVNGADILILDDVLHTGRTIRAVLNELFDYGRPARVRLAVLVDRGGRQLPVEATYAAARLSLPASDKLALARGEDGRLRFALQAFKGA